MGLAGEFYEPRMLEVKPTLPDPTVSSPELLWRLRDLSDVSFLHVTSRVRAFGATRTGLPNQVQNDTKS